MTYFVLYELIYFKVRSAAHTVLQLPVRSISKHVVLRTSTRTHVDVYDLCFEVRRVKLLHGTSTTPPVRTLHRIGVGFCCARLPLESLHESLQLTLPPFLVH